MSVCMLRIPTYIHVYVCMYSYIQLQSSCTHVYIYACVHIHMCIYTVYTHILYVCVCK